MGLIERVDGVSKAVEGATLDRSTSALAPAIARWANDTLSSGVLFPSSIWLALDRLLARLSLSSKFPSDEPPDCPSPTTNPRCLANLTDLGVDLVDRCSSVSSSVEWRGINRSGERLGALRTR